ncbi:bifunctional aminoglycoside phosphotransferase/ATP-binding protein [Actinomycetospora lemnae]|uniref:AAA family ATPase n=1 Tax=Actinomycetospora lemnae TaxID=3019891 RepID=A0ABT5SYH8_9PSEU|nr:AAA family ATPase [Actinomycetospora sp. DW7H6]MDD7967912.1 AAA family ATPase [Actinomycetospora sp. DW7H6]
MTGPGLAPAVVETHTAVLWFAGDRVHKMKKPVDLGFCDFTTLERRREACLREIALNRRLSPEAYLGLESLLGPDGMACEYLVAMRRMPAERRLAALVRAGEPVDDQLRTLARRLAAFHSTAARGPAVDREGTVDAARARWTGVLDGLRRHAGTILPADVVDHVAAAAGAFLDGRRALFERRCREGRVVDGHGDLLADDVFCLPDGPVVLDCLEFDDHLRYVDGLDDAAFLAMDLERLGNAGLAERFLGWYAEFADDPAPPALRHHLTAYRAAVRSSVTCVRVDQGGEGAELARDLLDLAAAHLDDGRVRLVLVGGLPGTGKTTVAGGLADRLGATLLSSDRVRKEIAGLDPSTGAAADYGTGLYGAEHTAATYGELLHRAEELLGLGESVVLDASWTAAAPREAATALAARASAALTSLRCEAPRAVADERIRRRRGSASDATPLVAAVMAADADPWLEATAIDTGGTVDAAVDAALAAVRTRRPHATWTVVEV